MLEKWKFREIVVLSALSVVFAVVYLLFVQFGNVLFGMFGLLGYEFIFGIWFIVSIISAYIIRKPGAAFLSETIAATIEVLIGNAMGPRLILSGIVQGAGAEAVFAATRYRSYNTWVLMLAGMGSSVTSFVWGYFVSGYGALDPGYVTTMFIVRLISGALLAGLLGKWLSDGLAQTGALNSFPLGKEVKRSKKHDIAS
ncbi:ECF transporter S component [Metabacillus iocasae]|uniref:Energy-coupling factor transport system substrate-specific component n=1 Tax=Priestia iocasae TaxID=2291674 RepID=A0ABS2QSM6_9BACI|nr:ECF transporter S component [Metabacillus iocasae]MBM7702456.1 energy-coupling factor transport system substrate-specific component [Metabacillus iocasae]